MSHLPAFVPPPDTVESLKRLLDQMLPPGVEAFADCITDQKESSEYPEELKTLSNAVQKRRNEFIVGRRCARAALAKLYVEPCALMPGKDRVPQWPAGIIGSISHSVELCCAVAARLDRIACLGVDLETTNRISNGVIGRVLHPLETEFVGSDQAFGSLLFSAKEAFFKAQFPTWSAWPNFDDLAFQVDGSSNGQLKVIYTAPSWSKSMRLAVEHMQFRYAFFNNYVLTLCWLGQARRSFDS